jgi:SAM-dependent methyltransferase
MFRHTARLYDLLYEASGKDYAQESSDLDALIQTHRLGARSLLDVACGTGGHLRHLRDRYDTTGVDIDPGMLGEAQRNLPEVTLVEADMRTLSLDRTFDAVVCLFSSIGYLRSPEELDQAVGAMAGHLSPGGVLIIDGWIRPDAWISGGTTQVTVASSDEVEVVRMSRSERQGDKTYLEMHHLVGTPEGIEHLVDHHELTLFTPGDYETAFRLSGLTVDTVESPLPGRDRYIGINGEDP